MTDIHFLLAIGMPFAIHLPGHLGMGELLDMPELDAIGTPWLYFNASHDPQWGATLPQGPWDSAALHGTLLGSLLGSLLGLCLLGF
jgi:hypothetical protein